MLLCALAPEAGASKRIRLPQQQDLENATTSAEALLNSHRRIERVLPGPVTDSEQVFVRFLASGQPDSVEVAQRLVVSGTGDFHFEIPGPALAARPLRGADSIPGLRKGSVVWQGFSDKRRELAAKMTLDPDAEAQRLPLRIEVTARVDGQPAVIGKEETGRLKLQVKIADVTERRFPFTLGAGPKRELARVLDAMRTNLGHGKDVRPGSDGVPTSLPVTGKPSQTNRGVTAPLHAVVGARLAGARLRPDGATRVTLGGGRGPEKVLTFTGHVSGELSPRVTVKASTAMPSLKQLKPPRAAPTWSSAASTGAVSSRAMFARAMTIAWQAASTRPFDAYLGNPQPGGRAVTTYEYSLTEPTREAAQPPSRSGSQGASLIAVTLWVLFGALVLLSLSVWWALA